MGDIHATPMFHGTAGDAFDGFMSCRPAFFTSNPRYAEVYAGKGEGASRIVEVRLDVRRAYDGRSAEDVTFWNEDFVPWMKDRFPEIARTLGPITSCDGVPFIWADDFFVHLRRTARSGTSTYDGMIVDEGGTGNEVGGSGLTVVPLHVTQIAIASIHAGT